MSVYLVHVINWVKMDVLKMSQDSRTEGSQKGPNHGCKVGTDDSPGTAPGERNEQEHCPGGEGLGRRCPQCCPVALILWLTSEMSVMFGPGQTWEWETQSRPHLGAGSPALEP